MKISVFAPFVALVALLTLVSALPTQVDVEKRYSGVRIKSYRDGSCVGIVAGRFLTNGNNVNKIDCKYGATWEINRGSGSIKLTGTDYTLDAGTGRDNNEGVKIWQSYPGLFQQTWYYTDDNRIAITGGNQCLDQGPDGPQTYQCTTGNTNQIWYVV